MSAFTNESSSHEGVPKGLYPLEPSRSDYVKVVKAHERNFHECVSE